MLESENYRLREAPTNMPVGRELLSGQLASFPLLCTWIRELQPRGAAQEDGDIRENERKLTAILIRQLRQFGFWETGDLCDCRNNLFMLMERKLGESMEFVVDKVLYAPEERLPMQAIELTALHLLRREPFAIVVRHPDLRSAPRYCGRLRDMADGSEVATLNELACVEDKGVPIPLPYDSLRHEQDALVILVPDDVGELAYYCGVRAVRHESLAIRMGFLVATARNMAREHARAGRKWRVLSPLEDLAPGNFPGRADNSHDAALLAAIQLVRRLPKRLHEQLVERYVDGLSWSEIAKRRKATEVKVRQDDSRTLRKLAQPFVATQPEARPGAVSRVVKWLKEMLPRILERQ
jgi:hypothetical protein